MKNIKCLMIVTICSLITICNFSIGYANDFASNHITLKNDEKETIKNSYPVIIVTNNTDKDLNVTYDFFVDIENSKNINKDILVPANKTIKVEIPELRHLGDSGETKVIWFSWMEQTKRKPLNTQIKTYPFKNNKAPVELG